MSGLLGIPKNKTLDGLTTGYFDKTYIVNETVETENISSNLNSTSISNSGNIDSSTYNSVSSYYISNLPTYETNTNTTLNSLQTQISNITSTSTLGGGYFVLEYETTNISSTNNSGYSWSSGSNLQNTNLYAILPSCNLIGASIYTTANVTSSTVIGVKKNNINSFNMTLPINTASVTFSSATLGQSLPFSYGDTIQVRSISGTSTVGAIISLIFSTTGIKGTDGISPSLSIGSVTSLTYGNTATASISGTQANPILNLGLVSGPTGQQGPIGLTGQQGPMGLTGQQGPIGLTGANGISPNLTIGTISSLDYGNTATATITGTQATPILNLGLITGPQGIQGGTGPKGDTGPKGSTGSNGKDGKDADSSVIAGLTATCVTASGAAGISATAAGISATASATSATASGISATAAQGYADDISAKLVYFRADNINNKEVCLTKLTVNDGITDRIILNPNGKSEFSYACQFDNLLLANNINNNNNSELTISSTSKLNLSSQTEININAPLINIGYNNMSSTIYLNGLVINPLDNWFNQFSSNNGYSSQTGI